MFEGPLKYIVIMALVIIVLRFVLRYAYSKADEQKKSDILQEHEIIDAESMNSDDQLSTIELERDLGEEIEADE